MKTTSLVGLYLAAIVAANLSIAHWGPKAAVFNAVAFIGADLVLRDRLHDAFGHGRALVFKMGLLIAAGSALSYIVSFWVTPGFLDVGRIALASCLAFGLAAVADASVYHWRRKQSWSDRANESNLAGSAVDSLVFPFVAGIPLTLTFVLTLWAAKVAGGYVFSLILRKASQQVLYPRLQGPARMKVYLGGPINGCTDNEANDWREYVIQSLGLSGVSYLNPMDRDYRGKEMEPGIAEEIVVNDKDDICNSTHMLMNCPKPSYGTAMEILYGYSMGKPVIVVHPKDAPVSPWVAYHATAVVHSLDDALAELVGC